jgi:tetratricopeptide (TPR) repeat protein
MLGRIVVTAGCLSLILVSISFSQSADAYTQARALLSRGKYSEAARAFEQLEQKQPSMTDALLQAAKARIHEQDYLSAQSDLAGFIAAHPQSEDALYLLSFVYFRRNLPKQSLQAANQAAAIKQPQPDDLKIVALDYSLLGDFDSAARYLEIARKMDPKNVEVLYYLGRARYQQNRFDEAIVAFRSVLAIDPLHVKAADNLGLALEGKGDFKSAEEAYRSAIAIAPKVNERYERPWLNLGKLLAHRNDVKNAIPEFEKALQINPDSAEGLLELGKAEMAVNDLQRARRHLERSVELDANSTAGHYSLARLYKKIGEDRLAEREFALTQKLNQIQH